MLQRQETACMTRIETSIVIESAVDTVWSVLIDYAAYGEWNPYVIQIEGSAEAGSLITVHSVPVAGADPMVAPVSVVSVAPYTMRWEGGLPDRTLFKGDHWFVLARDGDMTRLDHYEDFSGTLASGILNAHGEVIRGNFVRFNEALKARAEQLIYAAEQGNRIG
jgi:hypothetical protein